MICLYAETPISTLALILYTCMYIPFLHIAQAFSRLLSFILHPHQYPESTSFQCELDLPVSRIRDVAVLRCEKGRGGETCSICLMDFKGEDLVNRLPNCGHLFHVECIEKWMDRCKFTCPICRANLVLHFHSKPCITWSPCS